MTKKYHSFLSTPSFSVSRHQSPSNQVIQTQMFTDVISNEVKLRELKDAIINELHRKMAASSKTKLSCSIQTKSQMKTTLL